MIVANKARHACQTWHFPTAAVIIPQGVMRRFMPLMRNVTRSLAKRLSQGPVAVTPESEKAAEILDLYRKLTGDERNACLQMIGAISFAEAPFVMMNGMRLIEQGRFNDMIADGVLRLVLPIMVQEARKIAHELPDIPDEKFEAELLARVAASTTEFKQEIGELEQAKLKQKRDRKPDPEIIRRNVEICDLWAKDRAQWTQGKLARKYHLSPRAIRLILNDEQKWRQAAREHGE
ncbi:MAG TPA: hypothetical protein VGG64_15000 [Pirellulales bacterium]|jgi:hypothetical protein